VLLRQDHSDRQPRDKYDSTAGNDNTPIDKTGRSTAHLRQTGKSRGIARLRPIP
jgi:hypothetical protein